MGLSTLWALPAAHCATPGHTSAPSWTPDAGSHPPTALIHSTAQNSPRIGVPEAKIPQPAHQASQSQETSSILVVTQVTSPEPCGGPHSPTQGSFKHLGANALCSVTWPTTVATWTPPARPLLALPPPHRAPWHTHDTAPQGREVRPLSLLVTGSFHRQTPSADAYISLASAPRSPS